VRCGGGGGGKHFKIRFRREVRRQASDGCIDQQGEVSRKKRPERTSSCRGKVETLVGTSPCWKKIKKVRHWGKTRFCKGSNPFEKKKTLGKKEYPCERCRKIWVWETIRKREKKYSVGRDKKKKQSATCKGESVTETLLGGGGLEKKGSCSNNHRGL